MFSKRPDSKRNHSFSMEQVCSLALSTFVCPSQWTAVLLCIGRLCTAQCLDNRMLSNVPLPTSSTQYPPGTWRGCYNITDSVPEQGIFT